MKLRSLLLAGAATLGLAGGAYAAPAHVAGNSCGATATATTIVCNIRSDGLAVVSGDDIVGAFVWENHDTILTTSAAGSGSTLTFASGPPAAVAVGQFIGDNANQSAIPLGTTVTAVNTVAHTITISASATAVANGDGISVADATITDDKSNVYTMGDAIPSNEPTMQTFRLHNVTNGPTQLTVTYPATARFRALMSDEYSGLSALDVHADNLQYGTPSPTSGSVTTTAADLVYATTFNLGTATISAGSGLTLRQSSAVAGNFFGATEDLIQTSSGPAAGTFGSSVSDSYLTAVMAFTPNTNLPTPTGINCTPTSVADTATAGTSVCTFTVTMSDGSVYSSGTNTISPAGFFDESSSTGNGSVTLHRNLFGISDDGIHTFTMTAAKNGKTVTATPTLTVVPATAAGNPYSVGWKSLDPNGQVVFTAPRAMTVNEISMDVTVPAVGTALVDVYKISPGAASCTSGTKLHTSDLNAAGAAYHVQTVPLTSPNPTLAIYDSVCVATQQPFPTGGQATVTVTVN